MLCTQMQREIIHILSLMFLFQTLQLRSKIPTMNVLLNTSWRGNFKELWRIWVFKICCHENLLLNVSSIPSKTYFGLWESQLSTAPAVFTPKIRSRHQSRGKQGCCSHTGKNKVFAEKCLSIISKTGSMWENSRNIFFPFRKREVGPGTCGWMSPRGGVGQAPEIPVSVLGWSLPGTCPALNKRAAFSKRDSFVNGFLSPCII